MFQAGGADRSGLRVCLDIVRLRGGRDGGVGEGSGVLSHGNQNGREALQRVVSGLLPTSTSMFSE